MMHIPTAQPVKTRSRTEQIAERLEQIPESQQGIYRRAIERKSMAAAVKAFCYECMGYLREEVKVCTDRACPLWMYRPGRSTQKTVEVQNV